MQFFNYTKPKMLIADEGKKIREINDTYEAEHIDENGNTIEEHKPYYADVIFLPDSITEDDINKLYIEEIANEGEE